MRRPANYFELVEDYEAVHLRLRDGTPAEREDYCAQLIELALSLLTRHAATELERLAVWHSDKFYRLVNNVDVLDGGSFAFFRAIGAAFGAALQQHGVAVAYLADNHLERARLLGVQAAFSALGCVVVCPELLAVRLAEADGAALDEGTAWFERYRVEATILAQRLFHEAVAGRQSILWLSAEVDAAVLNALATTLDDSNYVGVFRNAAPTDGSEVQVFRSGGLRKALVF